MSSKYYKNLLFAILMTFSCFTATTRADFVENPMIEDLDANYYNISDVNELSAVDIIAEGPWVDVRVYESFADAVNGIDTAKTLLIPNQQDVTSTETVPPNIVLKFLNGGSLNISTGEVVTIEGSLDAGLYQIFTGDGTVSFSEPYKIYPQWWGADGTDTNYDTDALQAAFNSIIPGGHLVIPKGTYYFDDTLTFNDNYATLECFGKLIWDGDGVSPGVSAIVIGKTSGNTQDMEVSIYLQNYDPNGWGSEDIGVDCRNLIQCKIDIQKSYGFYKGLLVHGYNGGCAYNQFKLNDLRENAIAVDFKNTGGGWTNQNLFYGGRFSNVGLSPQTSYSNTRFINIPNESNSDNNTFIGPCLENSDPDTAPEHFVYCAGNNNLFLHPRNEDYASISNVHFDPNSRGNRWISGVGPTGMTENEHIIYDDEGSSNYIVTASQEKWGGSLKIVTSTPGSEKITFFNGDATSTIDIVAADITAARGYFTGASTDPAMFLTGRRPSIRQTLQESETAEFVAWSLIQCELGKDGDDTVEGGEIGLYGNLTEEAPYELCYMYLGVGNAVAHSSAFMKIKAEGDGDLGKLGLNLAGTTRPAYTLDVNGVCNATGYRSGEDVGIDETISIVGTVETHNLTFTNGLLTAYDTD